MPRRSDKASELDFLSGGGEMGALMRAHDWSRSPLGEPAGWPQSLRAVVALMINSRYPMFVAWGPDLVFLYNDGYAPIFGRKHPHMLGKPFREAWAEIWGDISPLIEKALAGHATYHENLHLVMERNGYPEDTWYSFSYSPVRDDTGAVAGMFCACQETTQQILADRRREEDAARQRKLFEQAPGFIAVTRGPDHIFEFANRAFDRLAGGRDVLGRGVRAAFPEIADQGLNEILDGVFEDKKRFVAEHASVRLLDAEGELKEFFLNFIYEPILDEHGQVLGIFIEGNDVTESHRAQAALLEAHERSRADMSERSAILSQLTEGVIVTDAQGRITFVNAAATRLHGVAALDVAPGEYSETYHLFRENGEPYPPEELPLARAAMKGETIADARWLIRRPDGSEIFAIGSAQPIHGEEGEQIGAVLTLRDDSARHHAEEGLRETAEELQAVLDAMPAAVWIARDAEGRDIVGNKASYDLLRLSQGRNASLSADETERPTNFRVFQGERELEPHELPVQAAARGEAVEQFEEEIRFDDGSVVAMYGNAAPLRDEQGRIRGAVAAFVDVTDLKSAEAALRESEERLRLVQAAGGIGSFDYDLQKDDAICSPEYYALFGLPDGHPINRETWNDAIHPEDRDKALGALQQAITERKPFDYEYRIVRADDGVVRWLAGRAAMIFDADDQPWRYVGGNIDVTERRMAEEKLRTSEARFREQFENANDFIFTADLDMRVTSANPAVANALGFKPEELVGRMIAEFVPAPERERNRAMLDAKLSGEKETTRYDVEVQGPDGPMVWEINSRLTRGADGAPNGLHAIGRDITLKKRAEEALRESEERFRELADNISQFAWTADTDGSINWYNQRWYDYTGTDFEEMKGWGWSKVHHPDHVDRVTENFRAKVNAGEIWEDLFPLRGADGGYRWYLSRARPIRDDKGRIVRWFGTNTDVTEQRAAEEELQALNETLEQRVEERTADLVHAQEALRQSQKLEAMGQLTGGVAHDFNNLLTPIVGSLDMLRRKGLGDEREQRLIDGALQSAERAKTLVQRLLAFARRQPLQASAVDVAQLVDGMADLVASTSGPQVKVVAEAAEGLPAAKADANQLEMAVLNLSVNARDAMPDGGTLTIAADCVDLAAGARADLDPGRYVRLSVSDTGQGMDEATLARAVEPFFSTKGIGKGTGLGLSMVHGLASQLGGALTLSSKPGLGTRVELWLPATDEAPGQEAVPAESGAASARAGTVLLVDDEPLVRASTADMLDDLGYEVIEAESGRQAIALFGQRRFDLLVTDHLMPGMSGTDLARALREERPDLPVLVVSGYADIEGITPDLPRLAKPFRQADLAAGIAALKDGEGA